MFAAIVADRASRLYCHHSFLGVTPRASPKLASSCGLVFEVIPPSHAEDPAGLWLAGANGLAELTEDPEPCATDLLRQQLHRAGRRRGQYGSGANWA